MGGYCRACHNHTLPNKEHVCGEDLDNDRMCRDIVAKEKALEGLLCALGWATQPDNPDGLFIHAQLRILRLKIWDAYKALGFTDEELIQVQVGGHHACVAR
jgi:hypothetical protein